MGSRGRRAAVRATPRAVGPRARASGPEGWRVEGRGSSPGSGPVTGAPPRINTRPHRVTSPSPRSGSSTSPGISTGSPTAPRRASSHRPRTLRRTDRWPPAARSGPSEWPVGCGHARFRVGEDGRGCRVTYTFRSRTARDNEWRGVLPGATEATHPGPRGVDHSKSTDREGNCALSSHLPVPGVVMSAGTGEELVTVDHCRGHTITSSRICVPHSAATPSTFSHPEGLL